MDKEVRALQPAFKEVFSSVKEVILRVVFAFKYSFVRLLIFCYLEEEIGHVSEPSLEITKLSSLPSKK